MDNIWRNRLLAFIHNAADVPAAAGALYPFLASLPLPVIAAAAITLSPVSVIGNVLRLRAMRPGGGR